MNKTIKYILILLGLIALFYLDFVRDYIFKNIGFQIYYLNHLTDNGTASINNFTDSFIEQFIKGYSLNDLINLKWIFTAIFSLIFGALGATINGLFYNTKKVVYYFSLMYIILFVSSLLIYSTTKLTNSYTFQTKAYLISMEVAHFLQSSLPTLFFLVSFKLYQQNKN